MATTFTAATVTYDRSYSPAVTLTRDTTGKLTAIIEVTGLAPDRTPNAEERKAGITSLDPPTVESRSRANRAKTIRFLLDAGHRAVAESVKATEGQATLTPADLSIICYKVSSAIRASLRAIGEDI